MAVAKAEETAVKEVVVLKEIKQRWSGHSLPDCH